MAKEVVVIATSNKGKFREIKKILSPLSKRYSFKSLGDLSIKLKVNENGRTYFENALKKARRCSELTGMISIADDSGLEVNSLNFKPGVHSARFSGKNSTDKKNVEKLLRVLSNTKDRRAKFVCAAVAYFPIDGAVLYSKGTVRGKIARATYGTQGFGYDPIFYYPALRKTFAQISAKGKNDISHRKKAFEKLVGKLKKISNKSD